jgi:hypothetical protein
MDSDWKEYSKLVLSELQRLNEDSKDAKEHHIQTNLLLQEYNTQLKIHIAATETLDEKTDLLKTQIFTFKTDTDKKFEAADKRLEVAELPIKWLAISAKLLAVAGGFSALIVSMIAIYKRFHP